MTLQASAIGSRRSIAGELRRLVLLAVLPLALVVAALTYASYREASEDARAVVMHEATMVSNSVTSFLAQTERALTLIARRPGVTKMDPAQCDPRLGDMIAIQPLFLNISTIDRTGRIVCSTEFPTDGSGAVNVSESKAFVGAMTGQPLSLGAVRKGRLGKLWVAFAATPVRTPGGDVAGAVVVAINLAGWLAPAPSSGLSSDMVIGAIEKAGRVALQQPDPGQWIGRDASSSESFTQAMRTVEGTFVAPGPQGTNRVWAVKPIPRTDWIAFAGVTADTAFATAHRNARIALALALAGMLGSVWAAVRAARRLTTPMADLARVAARVGGGASVRASPSGPAEVATVAVEFNRMLDKREASEVRYRALVDSLPEPVFVHRNGLLVYLNAEATRVFGAARAEDLIGTPILERVHPESRDIVTTRARQISEEGKSTPLLEHKFLKIDGTPIEVETQGTPIEFEGQRAIMIVGRDVSARRSAQEALRAADRRYQHILSYLHGAILLVGEDGRVEYCNQEFIRMFALDMWPEDLTGLGAREALERVSMSYPEPGAGRARVEAIVSDDKPVIGELIQLTGDRSVLRDYTPIILGSQKFGGLWHHQDVSELLRAQSDLAKRSRHMRMILDAMPELVVHVGGELRHTAANRPFSEFYERKQVMPDGSKRDLLVHTLPDVGEHGEIEGLMSMTLDVTEQRNAERAARDSEERLGDVIASVDGIVWEADARTLTFTSVSSNVERLLGYPSADWLAPGFWAAHIHPEDRDATLASCARHTQALENHDFEYRFIAADGRSAWLRDQVTVVASDGKPGLLRGVMTDISQRKRDEAARASLEAQLRETQKMAAIGTLAGGIAHDFNNILATILGNADLAHEDARGIEAVNESLDEIRKAGLRGRDLVKQILAFSRRQPTERKRLDLAEVVEEAARLLRATLPGRITLEVHCAPGLPAALADATQIEQVVLNLATNGMQAMRGLSGRLRIMLDTVELDAPFCASRPVLRPLLARHPGLALRLTVSDDGPGMAADVLERIFEPFFTTKPVGEGTGLGLAVVHGIVENHEGAIEARSTPGAGATFTLYLPCASPSAPAATETAAPSGAPETAPGSRVLYLDDDTALVSLVTRLLERRGFQVTAHTNQKEALAALRADPAAFDLVVTDYNMPGMSGLDVACAVRAIRPGLPVAVASGFVDERLSEEAAEAGVREVIFKATSVDEYCATLQRLVRATGSADER